MGFNYLGGKRWSQVTRDERFFCQRLYELVNTEPVGEFAQYMSDQLDLELPVHEEWEIGFEVCFYRDLWQHRGREGALYSPKRTFDLCLFAESAIVIIEAKAAGGFDPDQNETFKRDVEEVRRLTGVGDVYLVCLCSSKCENDKSSKETFGRRGLHWDQLAQRYNGDEILQRANGIYVKSQPFSSRGPYSDKRLSGAALLEAFQGGAEWWVGRGGGGISGKLFLEDIRVGRWKTQVYEVNTTADSPPSPNYFSLAQFVRAVEGEGTIKQRL
jgi:hypothetical protein